MSPSSPSGVSPSSPSGVSPSSPSGVSAIDMASPVWF